MSERSGTNYMKYQKEYIEALKSSSFKTEVKNAIIYILENPNDQNLHSNISKKYGIKPKTTYSVVREAMGVLSFISNLPVEIAARKDTKTTPENEDKLGKIESIVEAAVLKVFGQFFGQISSPKNDQNIENDANGQSLTQCVISKTDLSYDAARQSRCDGNHSGKVENASYPIYSYKEGLDRKKNSDDSFIDSEKAVENPAGQKITKTFDGLLLDLRATSAAEQPKPNEFRGYLRGFMDSCKENGIQVGDLDNAYSKKRTIEALGIRDPKSQNAKRHKTLLDLLGREYDQAVALTYGSRIDFVSDPTPSPSKESEGRGKLPEKPKPKYEKYIPDPKAMEWINKTYKF